VAQGSWCQSGRVKAVAVIGSIPILAQLKKSKNVKENYYICKTF